MHGNTKYKGEGSCRDFFPSESNSGGASLLSAFCQISPLRSFPSRAGEVDHPRFPLCSRDSFLSLLSLSRMCGEFGRRDMCGEMGLGEWGNLAWNMTTLPSPPASIAPSESGATLSSTFRLISFAPLLLPLSARVTRWNRTLNPQPGALFSPALLPFTSSISHRQRQKRRKGKSPCTP